MNRGMEAPFGVGMSSVKFPQLQGRDTASCSLWVELISECWVRLCFARGMDGGVSYRSTVLLPAGVAGDTVEKCEVLIWRERARVCVYVFVRVSVLWHLGLTVSACHTEVLAVKPAVAGSRTRPKLRLSVPSLCHGFHFIYYKELQVCFTEFSFALIIVLLASPGQLDPSKLFVTSLFSGCRP